MPPTLDGTSEESSTYDEATPLDAGTDPGATPSENQEAASKSSTEADGKEAVSEADFDPLSVVKKAVEKSKETEERTGEGRSKQSDESSKSESDGQKPEDGEGELGEVTEEELKDLQEAGLVAGLFDDMTSSYYSSDYSIFWQHSN